MTTALPFDLTARLAELGINLDEIRLEQGAHEATQDAFCVMELTSYIAREPWSDHPTCVSDVIGAFLRSWNDGVDDDFRQRLKPYAIKAIGTKTGDNDETVRAWMATDWLVRTYTPAWLELAGLHEHATKLRELTPLTSDEIAIAVQDLLDQVSTDAYAKYEAAWSAAWSAARSAAESAAWSAARSAAESAAWSAARSAAESAAWSAARSAAESAAESAAWSAARSAVEPTAKQLQESAFELLDRMIAVGK